jgi:hypothetical protein
MKIDNDLEIVVCSPGNSFTEIRKLSLNVWFPWSNFEGPIPDGETDVIQSDGVVKAH